MDVLPSKELKNAFEYAEADGVVELPPNGKTLVRGGTPGNANPVGFGFRFGLIF